MLMLAIWMMHHLTHRNISFTDLGKPKQIAAQGGYAAMGVLVVCDRAGRNGKIGSISVYQLVTQAMEGQPPHPLYFYGSLSVHIGIFYCCAHTRSSKDMLWAKILIIVTGAVTAVLSTLIARVQPTVKPR